MPKWWLLTPLFLIAVSEVKAQVVINEFSVNPADKQDWVEIYSPETIDVSGWKVEDEAGVFFYDSGGNYAWT